MKKLSFIIFLTIMPFFLQGAEIQNSWPYQNRIGIDVSYNCTNWYAGYDPTKQVKDCEQRWNKIFDSGFRLVRIYHFINPWYLAPSHPLPPTYDGADRIGQSLSKVISSRKDLSKLEIIVGTANNVTFFSNPTNVDLWVKCLKATMGSNVDKVKTILFGNEVNGLFNDGLTPKVLSTILNNFKSSLKKYGLSNIPVTVSFSMVDSQSGGVDSPYINKIKSNWAWNSIHRPFVFADPYPSPDVKAKTNYGQQVLDSYNKMEKYWSNQGLDVYILETGAQGSPDDKTSVKMVNDIAKVVHYENNIPMFIFEAVNEPLKEPDTPEQHYMGIFNDTDTGITDFKSGIETKYLFNTSTDNISLNSDGQITEDI